jgi:4'-phosphopantetheinyl transferase
VATHDVHIWFRATDGLDAAAIAAAASVLSDEERAQYARFHFVRDARDYAAAHALLRTVLSHDGDLRPESWQFERTPHGKPFLIGHGEARTSFSLSHAHGMVACAVTAGGIDLGVDVECLDREVDALDIATRFFSPAETQLLARLDSESRRRRFFDLWTLKEALVKATGAGLSTPLSSVAFTVGAAGDVTLEAPALIDADSWQFGLFAPGPKHRLAVAVRRTTSPRVQLILRSVAPDT